MHIFGKRLLKYIAGVIVIMVVSVSCSTPLRVTDRLAGRDLPKLEERLVKQARAGRPDAQILLAEVLFAQGKHQRAFNAYTRAYNLGQITTTRQKRNFAHAARAIGSESPFDTNTGYFKSLPQQEILISPFCGNSINEDIFPYQWNEYLFITSSRLRNGDTYTFTQRPYLNVFAFGEGCRPIPFPSILPQGINTRFHDGPISISADTTLVVVNRTFRKRSRDRVMNLYLDYYYKDSHGNWQGPILFPYSNVEYSVQHPVFNNQLQTLFFSSDMPGGYGGFDLYSSAWNGREWERPVNLGPEINTIYDEVSPSFDASGNLIYATNHIETTGGLDLVLFKDGQRYLLPHPINTPFDDYGITYSDRHNGYLSSTRDRGAFRDNIYQFSIIERYQFELYVSVFDNATQAPIEGVFVRFDAIGHSVSGQILTNEQGKAYLFGRDTLMHGAIWITLNNQDFEPQTFKLDYDLLEEMPEGYVLRVGLDRIELAVNQIKPEPQPIKPAEEPKPEPTPAEPVVETREVVAPKEPEPIVEMVEETVPKEPEKPVVVVEETIAKEVEKPITPVTEPLPSEPGLHIAPPHQPVLTRREQPEVNIASGDIILYFENSIPFPGSPITPFDITVHNYLISRDRYLHYSPSHPDEVLGFFNEIKYGFEALNALAQFIYDNKEDNTFDIFLRSYASPRTNPVHNKALTERRGESVKNFFSNWRGGALRPHIDTENIHISTVPYGDTKAPPSVSASLEDPAANIYSVEASRERRVVVYWSFGSHPPRPILAKAEPAPQPAHQEVQEPTAQPTQQLPAARPVTPQEDRPGKYYIVVGSTPSYIDAVNFLRQLQARGFSNAGMKMSDRRWHRIYAQVYNSLHEAEEAIGKYRLQIDRQAWILFQEE